MVLTIHAIQIQWNNIGMEEQEQNEKKSVWKKDSYM